MFCLPLVAKTPKALGVFVRGAATGRGMLDAGATICGIRSSRPVVSRFLDRREETSAVRLVTSQTRKGASDVNERSFDEARDFGDGCSGLSRLGDCLLYTGFDSSSGQFEIKGRRLATRLIGMQRRTSQRSRCSILPRNR